MDPHLEPMSTATDAAAEEHERRLFSSSSTDKTEIRITLYLFPLKNVPRCRRECQMIGPQSASNTCLLSPQVSIRWLLR